MFYKEAKSVKYKPLMGARPMLRGRPEGTGAKARQYYHLTLIARTAEGHKNSFSTCGYFPGRLHHAAWITEMPASTGRNLPGASPMRRDQDPEGAF